jgi:hypothetical protein
MSWVVCKKACEKYVDRYLSIKAPLAFISHSHNIRFRGQRLLIFIFSLTWTRFRRTCNQILKHFWFHKVSFICQSHRAKDSISNQWSQLFLSVGAKKSWPKKWKYKIYIFLGKSWAISPTFNTHWRDCFGCNRWLRHILKSMMINCHLCSICFVQQKHWCMCSKQRLFLYSDEYLLVFECLASSQLDCLPRDLFYLHCLNLCCSVSRQFCINRHIHSQMMSDPTQSKLGYWH